jgi:hypothetical protein
MQKKLLLAGFGAFFFMGLLNGCSNDDGSATTSTQASTSTTSTTSTTTTAAQATEPNNQSLTGSTPTGIITADGFFMLFNPGVPAVIDTPVRVDPGPFGLRFPYTETSVTITIRGDDINDLEVAGQRVKFKTEWGTFVDGDSCLMENNSCQVTWRSGNPATVPQDCSVAITAMVIGEESFDDLDGDNQFDSNETVSTDLSEPFLDINGDGIYTPGLVTFEGVAEIIDIDNQTGATPGDGAHNAADGLYTGTPCATGNPQCTSNSSMVIHTRARILIQERFDEQDDDLNNDGDSTDKNVNYCSNFGY